MDRRLTEQLVRAAGLLPEEPGSEGSVNLVEAYRHQIEAPDKWAATMEAVQAPHRQGTIQRMRGQRTVLCIHDRVELRFGEGPLGYSLEFIGRREAGRKPKWLPVHATLAVTPQGLPLGVLRCGFGTLPGRKTKRRNDGYRDIAKAAQSLTRRTRLIAVTDRAGGYRKLLRDWNPAGPVDILVRARLDCALAQPAGQLFAAMAGGAPGGRIEVPVEGPAGQPRPSSERLARCVLRYRRVRLRPKTRSGEPLSLWGIHVAETHPPEGRPAVRWHLLTSLPVDSAGDAEEMVGHYMQRLRTKDYFRVLRKGCVAERQRATDASELQRAVTVSSVVAWRVMGMTLLERQVPGLDVGQVFAAGELGFLAAYARENDFPPPDSLGAALQLVARLGGHRDGKDVGAPGLETIWMGYTYLTSATIGFIVHPAWREARRSEN